MSTINDEDADLEAGFSPATPGQSATDSLDDDAPAAIVEPKADAAEAADEGREPEKAEADEPAPDPLAGLPQPVRDMMADYQRTKVEIESLRRTAGQVPALQARIDKLTAAATATAKAAEPAKPRFEKVAKLRGDGLDEIADAFDEVVGALRKPEPNPEPEPETPKETTVDVDTQTEVLDEVRPDWADLVFGNDFQLWLASQPAPYQQEVRGASRAKVILGAIKAFEQAKAKTQQVQQSTDSRTRRMASAVTPRGDGRTLARQPAPEDEDADLEVGFRRQSY